MRIFMATIAVLALSHVAVAQTAQPKVKCGDRKAPAVEAPTKLEKGADSGAKNGGSTGWSGSGMGGSTNGTTASGPTASSPNEHPETAKGLDPTKDTKC